MSAYNWYACSGTSKEGYMCSKPMMHKGTCEASFVSSSVPFVSVSSTELGEMPIVITQEEADEFLDIKPTNLWK